MTCQYLTTVKNWSKKKSDPATLSRVTRADSHFHLLLPLPCRSRQAYLPLPIISPPAASPHPARASPAAFYEYPLPCHSSPKTTVRPPGRVPVSLHAVYHAFTDSCQSLQLAQWRPPTLQFNQYWPSYFIRQLLKCATIRCANLFFYQRHYLIIRRTPFRGIFYERKQSFLLPSQSYPHAHG